MGKKMQDLTGKKFGKLTVIGFSHRMGSTYYWNCMCECGNSHRVTSGNLKRGMVKSCGCLGSGRPKKENKRDYFQPSEIKLKQKIKGRCGKIKCYKLSQRELEKYLNVLKYKEVQYVSRGEKNV